MATKKSSPVAATTNNSALSGPDFGAVVEAQAQVATIPAGVNPFVRSLPLADAMEATKETRTLSQIERDTKKPAISADVTGTVLTIEFSHGEVIRLDASTLSESIRNDAIMHGLKQKLVDAAAIPRDTNTGRSASLQDKYLAILEVANRVQGIGEDDGKPSWNKVRAGGTASSGGNGGLLLRALVELTNKPKAEVEAWLEGMSKEQKAGFKQDQSVMAIMARMQAEKAPAAVKLDTASLLAGFMGKS